jgi:hypothetical protein
MPFTVQKWATYAAKHARFSSVKHAFRLKKPCFYSFNSMIKVNVC